MPGSEKHGISGPPNWWARIHASMGADEQRSVRVRETSILGLDAERTLAEHGVIIDDFDARRERVRELLEAGIAAKYD